MCVAAGQFDPAEYLDIVDRNGKPFGFYIDDSLGLPPDRDAVAQIARKHRVDEDHCSDPCVIRERLMITPTKQDHAVTHERIK